MLRFLPVGWMGLMLGGLIAANSSTILTHLNWGASYLVHDFYRRFLNTGATEKHYVMAGRFATVLLFVGSSAMVFCSRHRQGQLQPVPPGRRGHRPALSAALVLVARHRVVRDRGDDQFLRRLHCFPDPFQERCGLRLLRTTPHRHCDHHRLLDRRRLSRPADRPGGAAPTSTKRSGRSAPAGGTYRRSRASPKSRETTSPWRSRAGRWAAP